MEYTELQEKMAQRIFDIGFVKKAHFQIEDCRYMVRSFYDLAEPKFAINTDLYEALKDILPELKEYVQEVGDCDHSVGICFCGLFNKIDNLEQALSKAEGRDDT